MKQNPAYKTCAIDLLSMIRHLVVVFLLFFFLPGKTQCPEILNTLGVYTSSPQFINCNGSVFNLNFQSNSSFGTYTINWGDGGPVTTGGSYNANTIMSHSYAATTATYPLTLLTGTCTINGIVVQEQAAQAAIIPGNVGSNLCAPKTLTFTNGTTFTSTTTNYTWSFGDQANTNTIHTFTNSGKDVVFTYLKGQVNCNTQVTLSAQNYCNFTPSRATFGPLQVYDIDQAQIAPDRPIRCWPDNAFTFNNTSNRTCEPQGNNGQRYERWNFGDHWGLGHDSLLAWSPWFPTPPRTISFPFMGSYSVSLLDSNACGISSVAININIVPPPTANLAGPSGNICINTAITFTNLNTGATQHRWNFGTGAGFVNLGSGNKSFTYTTPGTYTVMLIALINGGGNACMDTAKTVVNIVDRPTASLSAAPASGCGSLSASFTDLSTGASSWNWNFGNGVTSNLQAPPVQSYTSAGLYVATLAVTNTNSCTDSKTVSLIVHSKPVPAFVQFSACEDTPVTFTNNSVISGTSAITGYTWQFGDGTASSSAFNPVHTYTVPGSYIVKLVTASAFCRDSVSMTVSVNIVPTASFVASPTVGCPPFTVNFSNVSQNANNFLWRFTSAPTETSNSTGALYTYTNGSQSIVTHTVKLISSTFSGCADSITAIVSVRPKPIAGFSVNTITGCSPKITSFTNTSIGGSTYAWSFGDNSFSTSVNPSHTYSNGTLFTQTVIANLITTNSLTCSDTTEMLITVYAEALTTFTMVPAQGCSPLVVNFPSVPGVATYTWNHGDGAGNYNTLTSHTYTFYNAGTTPKTCSVVMNSQTSNVCFGTVKGNLLVFHNPVANFVADKSAGCTPFSVNFNNTGTGYSTSKWFYGNGATSLSQNGQSTYTNATGNGINTYSVKLSIGTADGCRDSIIKTISVFGQPSAGFTPDTPACTPKIIKFTNSSTGATTFSWKFGNGSTSTLSSPEVLFVNNGPTDMSFPVQLTAASVEGCKDSVTVPVAVHPKPKFEIASAPDSGCAPLKVTFAKIGGVVDYEWKYDGISFGSSGGIQNTFGNNLGVNKTYTVQLIARDKYKCVDTATKLIKVFPLPVARFSARPLSVFVPNQEVTFTNESSSIATTFSWTLGDGTKSNERSPSHYYTTPGEYKITMIARTDKGCRDTFALPEPVIAQEETTIQMPNAFTPNTSGSPGIVFDPNDTSNDIFHPNVKGTEQYTFSIFSRWGELLFETKNPLEGWDGYYKGTLCTPDVYVWKVNATFIDGKTFNKTGDVLLLR